MSNWRIKFTPEGEKDLLSLDKAVQKRVIRKIYWFEENFANIAPEPLSNVWKDYFKLRVGDWRIVYQVEHNANSLIIHSIELRDKVYKKR
ncbi:MAG: type II toxin-antitoxin system RelE/ParE family toxin [Patescibacteria group bacterium]